MCTKRNSHTRGSRIMIARKRTQICRGEMCRENVLAFGAISEFDWFRAKTKSAIPYIGPAVGTVVHLTAGSEWLAQCW